MVNGTLANGTADPGQKKKKKAPKAPRTLPRERPGLLRPDRAAVWADVSRPTWDRMVAAGETPAPVITRGCIMFSRRQLELWALWGCPPRTEFEARLAQRGR